jgi:hypothetical protein
MDIPWEMWKRSRRNTYIAATRKELNADKWVGVLSKFTDEYERKLLRKVWRRRSKVFSFSIVDLKTAGKHDTAVVIAFRHFVSVCCRIRMFKFTILGKPERHKRVSLLVDTIGFWRWCITHRDTGFLDFAHRPDSKLLKTTFRKLDLFPSSG